MRASVAISHHARRMACAAGIAIAALGAHARLAVAQATPEAATVAYTQALAKGDFAGATRLMHPDAVHQIRVLFEPLVTSSAGAPLAKELFGMSSAAKVTAAPDTVLFANFLKAVMARDPAMQAMLKSAVVTPLGNVAQPGDTALVVSRATITMEGMTITTYDVSAWVKVQGVYKGLLKADFTNMASMLKARFGKAS